MSGVHPQRSSCQPPHQQKHERRDADLLLSLVAEERLPALWVPTRRTVCLRLYCDTASVGGPSGAVKIQNRTAGPLPWVEWASSGVSSLWTQAGHHALRRLCHCRLTPRIAAHELQPGGGNAMCKSRQRSEIKVSELSSNHFIPTDATLSRSTERRT